MSKKGYKMSEEQKIKIGLANKGKIHSIEWRKNTSLAKKGCKSSYGMLGKKHSIETRLKMKKSMTGIKKGVRTLEHRLKLSLSLKGKKRILTEEGKKSISEKMSGIKNPMWKGEDAGYYAFHYSISKDFGKASYCENRYSNILNFNCSCKSKTFQWAKKINSQYTRNKEDYYQLCASCHKKYDNNAKQNKL